MRSQPVIAALLLSMLLQAVSLGGHWTASAAPGEALHALLHWAGILHHHDHGEEHDDDDDHEMDPAPVGPLAMRALDDRQPVARAPEQAGAQRPGQRQQGHAHALQLFYQDHSLDSRHHLSLDVFVSVIALIPSMPVSPIMELEAPPPMSGPVLEPADPFLNGPRRPPRSLA